MLEQPALSYINYRAFRIAHPLIEECLMNIATKSDAMMEPAGERDYCIKNV